MWSQKLVTEKIIMSYSIFLLQQAFYEDYYIIFYLVQQ